MQGRRGSNQRLVLRARAAHDTVSCRTGRVSFRVDLCGRCKRRPSMNPNEFQRCLRDIVSLCGLPSLWTEADAQTISSDLTEIVFQTLGLDLVVLLLRRVGSLEMIRVRDGRDAGLLPRIRDAVSNCPPETAMDIRGAGALGLTTERISASHSDDLMVAGSYRSDFPTVTERLLLRIAANQAGACLQRRHAEDALAAESRFRTAIENSMLAGVVAADLSGHQTYVNRAFAQMVGWPPENLVGSTAPFPYWAPEDGDRIAETIAHGLSADVGRAGAEVTFRRRNGERFDALVLVSPLREHTSSTAGYVASVYDVTDRKRIERAAAMLAETGEIAARCLDERTLLEAVSALAVREFADWSFVDLVETADRSERMAVAHRDPAGAAAARKLMRLGGAPPPPDVMMMNAVSSPFLESWCGDAEELAALEALNIVSFLCVPLSCRGELIGARYFLRCGSAAAFEPADVALAQELCRRTALSVANAQLFAAARNANRMKDEFMARFSHELKTPLTATLGWIRLIREGGLSTEETGEALQSIEASASAQARLIEDLLDVSRIITGKLKLEPADVDLNEIVSAASAIVRPAASMKKQTIAVHLSAEPLPVVADSARLQQVLWNLLTNAVKFTPAEGRIDVIARGDDEHAAVVVADNGPGIAPDALPIIFDRFGQGAGAERQGGLGLGLAIAREVVELHGGSIRVESDGTSGSTFTVTLPRKKEEEGGQS
jgi:PAS domain S-box-containing protein